MYPTVRVPENYSAFTARIESCLRFNTEIAKRTNKKEVMEMD